MALARPAGATHWPGQARAQTRTATVCQCHWRCLAVPLAVPVNTHIVNFKLNALQYGELEGKLEAAEELVP